MNRGFLWMATSLLVPFLCLPWATAASSTSLKIYFVDVEGGQSTLFVTPTGQSLLVDTGWPGFNGRDADRIVAAAKDAGLSKIDYVLITHFHMDHVGGVPQLAERFPIGTFIDHGENRETTDQRGVGAGGRVVLLEAGRIVFSGATPALLGIEVFGHQPE